MTKEINVNNVKIGGANPLVLIAGPCVIEDEQSAVFHAGAIKEIAERVEVPFIFKSSYDKANRSSIDSFRGPGLKQGLEILRRVREKTSVPVLSDVHCRSDVEIVKGVLDIIQIPALLSRQTDLITACALTGKAVNIKKGQFMSPADMRNVVGKVVKTGNRRLLLTERGVSFGYNNLVSDMRSLDIMREFGYPVIYDATHSVQLPGERGVSSGGQRGFIPGLCRAAAAMGCDGIFVEVHRRPEGAPCDGPNMLELDKLEDLLKQVKQIDQIVKPV